MFVEVEMKVVPWKVKVLFALSMMITFYPKRWRGSEPCVNLVTFNFIYAETTYILHLQPCVSYPLNKSNIFTGCYFHTVKIKKIYYIHCVKLTNVCDVTLWTAYNVQNLKETCSKMKENVMSRIINVLDIEYEIYFTH